MGNILLLFRAATHNAHVFFTENQGNILPVTIEVLIQVNLVEMFLQKTFCDNGHILKGIVRRLLSFPIPLELEVIAS